MKALILGGSFDPPHRGHIALLKAAADAIKPDRIFVVPAHHAPLKDAAPGASAADRLKLLDLGLAELPRRWRARTAVDRFEMKKGRRVYTVETLRHFRSGFPSVELHFAAGWDAAAAFARWKQPARLKALASWWTARRPGSAGKAPPHFRALTAPMPDISSSEIRARLALGRSAAGTMAPAALRLIMRRRLYGLDRVARLRAELHPFRFEHTLAVAELAEALARRWGLDPGKALLAGLLHDCGRAIPVERMVDYVRRRKIAVPDLKNVARHHPLLAHAYISADLARSRYGVRDREVLDAVRRHTLGALAMSALDKTLYVADSASRDRRHPGVERLRGLAFRDLNQAFRECVRQKLDHVRGSGHWAHPLSLRLWKRIR